MTPPFHLPLNGEVGPSAVNLDPNSALIHSMSGLTFAKQVGKYILDLHPDFHAVFLQIDRIPTLLLPTLSFLLYACLLYTSLLYTSLPYSSLPYSLLSFLPSLISFNFLLYSFLPFSFRPFSFRPFPPFS